MPGVLLPSRMRANQPGGAAESPAPGFFEGVAASFRTAEDEQDLLEQAPRNAEAYHDLLDALSDIGVDTSKQGKLYSNGGSVPFDIRGGTRRILNRDAVLAEVAAQRRADPKRFSDIPETREEYDQMIARRFGERDKDLRTASRAGLTANLTGGMASAMTDPVNIILGVMGAPATGMVRTILTEGALGGLSEVVMLPDASNAFDRMGEDFTVTDAATRVLTGTLASGALGGAAKFGFDNFDKIRAAPRAVQEAAWARIIPYLPESKRPAMNWDIAADHLPDIAEGLIGRENLSGDEIASIAILRQQDAVTRASPFTASGAGAELHGESMETALTRIIDQAQGRNLSTPRGPSAPAALRGSTAIASGNVAGTGRDILKQRIGVVESSGGRNYANPNSSARGLYQFVDGTWLTYYKRRFGSGGLSDSQILAKRRDANVQNILMDDLTADNARALGKAGIAESAGNLYLAHFAGSGGAVKLHGADPSAPVAAVLGRDVVAANPFLKGMTARDVIDWAHRKMGQRTAAGPAARVREDVGEADMRDALQREIDSLENERLRIEDDLADSGEQVSAAVRGAMDAEPVPVGLSADDIVPARPVEPTASLSSPPPAEVQAVLPQLRDKVKDSNVSLNQNLDQLAADLGVSEAQLREGLQALALDGTIRQNKNGAFARPSRGPDGPDDLLRFVARQGGLTPTGLYRDANAVDQSAGHDLGTILETTRQQPVRDELTGKKIKKPVRIGNRLVPGVGNVLRETGRSLDDMGELLHEAGYFPERPTEDQVIDALSRAAAGEKIFADADIGDVLAREESARLADNGEEFDYYSNIAQDRYGFDLSEEDFLAARAMPSQPGTEFLDLDDDIALKIQSMVGRQIDDIIDEAWEAGKDDVYELLDEQFSRSLEGENRGGTGYRDGPENAEGDAGQSGAGSGQGPENSGRAGLAPEDTGPIDPDSYKDFDDPDGPAVQAVADSLEHDMRAKLIASARPLYSPDNDAIPLDSPTTGELWKLGDDELEALEQSLQLAEDENVRRAFGDDAAFEKWKKIRSRDARDAALNEIDFDEKGAMLVFGNVADPRATSDEVRDIIKAIGYIEPDDSQTHILGEMVNAIGRIDMATIEKVIAGEGMAFEQARFITFRNGAAALEMKGVAQDQIPGLLINEYKRQGIEDADALAMVSRIFGDMEAKPARAADIPELSGPDNGSAPDDFTARFEQVWDGGEDPIHDLRVQMMEEFPDRQVEILDAMEAAENKLGPMKEVIEAQQARAESAKAWGEKASRIVEGVAAGKPFRHYTPGTNKVWEITDPTTIRAASDGLQIRRGQNWDYIPQNELDGILAQQGDAPQADFAAPTPDQARTALERQAEGRLQSARAQKAAGSDGGLFDNTGLRDMALDFDPEGNVSRTVGQLFEELDAETKMIDDIKGCL